MPAIARVLALFPLALMLSAQTPRIRPAPPNAPARIRRMDPKQRESLLERLPPDRRKQAADRLNRLKSLSPEQREQLEKRWEQFRRMSPENREKARDLFRDFNALPEERREALSAEFAQLKSLSPEARSSRLKADELAKRFSKKERQILRRYAELSPAERD